MGVFFTLASGEGRKIKVCLVLTTVARANWFVRAHGVTGVG